MLSTHGIIVVYYNTFKELFYKLLNNKYLYYVVFHNIVWQNTSDEVIGELEG